MEQSPFLQASAVKLLGHCKNGETVPLYIECTSSNLEQATVFQTKVAGKLSGLRERELVTELLCTLIARDLGLLTAKPAIISLSNSICELIEKNYTFQIGCFDAIGFEWLRDVTPILSRVHLGRSFSRDWARLLALDVLVVNGDRTPLNPNLAWKGERLLVFDFEHCFELPDGSPKKKFEMHCSLLENLMESHIIGPKPMVDPSVVVKELVSLLDCLNITGLQRLSSRLPESWFPYWDELVRYLEYIRANRDPLVERIGELLG